MMMSDHSIVSILNFTAKSNKTALYKIASMDTSLDSIFYKSHLLSAVTENNLALVIDILETCRGNIPPWGFGDAIFSASFSNHDDVLIHLLSQAISSNIIANIRTEIFWWALEYSLKNNMHGSEAINICMNCLF